MSIYNTLDEAYRTHEADYAQMYADAEKQLSEENYDGATTVFRSISGYEDADTQAQESQYQKAVTMNQSGDYDGAYDIFATLSGYKDADSIIENDDNIAAVAWYARFETGNTVTYGQYEQDNNIANGAEAIEWIVLANDGKSATLISKYGLDAKPYNIERTDITWGDCTLRKWLNGDFLRKAFTVDEQAMLKSVTVKADNVLEYDTNTSNDKQDKVFLLSIAEAIRFFDTDKARVCIPTRTAVENGVVKHEDGACWWWLRSPGNNPGNAAYVRSVGSVFNDGNFVDVDYGAVRPVIIICRV